MNFGISENQYHIISRNIMTYHDIRALVYVINPYHTISHYITSYHNISETPYQTRITKSYHKPGITNSVIWPTL